MNFPCSDHIAGEEICTSYLHECMLQRSRHSRQKELQENYLFVCTCPRCEEQKEDPDITSDEEEDDDDEDDEEGMDEDDWKHLSRIRVRFFFRYKKHSYWNENKVEFENLNS